MKSFQNNGLVIVYLGKLEFILIRRFGIFATWKQIEMIDFVVNICIEYVSKLMAQNNKYKLEFCVGWVWFCWSAVHRKPMPCYMAPVYVDCTVLYAIRFLLFVPWLYSLCPHIKYTIRTANQTKLLFSYGNRKWWQTIVIFIILIESDAFGVSWFAGNFRLNSRISFTVVCNTIQTYSFLIARRRPWLPEDYLPVTMWWTQFEQIKQDDQ